MKADKRFLRQPKTFWANVRTISQECGYTKRRTGTVKVPSFADMLAAMEQAGLGNAHLLSDGEPSLVADTLSDYFKHRAEVLNTFVEPRLMDLNEARQLFDKLRDDLNPTCPFPKNKQKGAKAGPALLTGIVNMLVEAHADGVPVDFDPRKLTTVTYNDAPLRTLARRVDGAFPSTVNPVAVWEIKEYYHTTTFGSRIADGVYESLLDGMELEELREHEGIDVQHVLMVDSHFTWWKCGRSYLCRLIDMLHMGYVDEVLFGKEVMDVLPGLVGSWASVSKSRTP